MTYETLQYVDANGATQEVALQSLSAGGTVRSQMLPRSLAPSEFHIILPQPPETPIAIPFKSRCIVYACRLSATGANNSFSGGSILFQGRRTDNNASADGGHFSNEIVISDAFWDLKKITFQSFWNIINGGTLNNPTFQAFAFTDSVLFQANPGQVYNPAPVVLHITSWQQIQDIITYATEFASGSDAVQLALAAAPEFTPSYAPWYPVRCMKCADAIAICMRPHPGVYSEIDYTQTPPVLHFRDRSHMTALTLPYASTLADGTTHLATEIAALPELIPARVAIYYKITSQLNGQPVIGFSDDIYPLGSGPALLSDDYSVDITGASYQSTVKNFQSYAFSPIDLTMWRAKMPSLRQQSQGGQIINDGNAGALSIVDVNPYDPILHPKGIQVLDYLGNPIDYQGTYTFWTEDDVMKWFAVGFSNNAFVPAVAIRATVKAFFTYTRQSTVQKTTISDVISEHEESIRLVLTNAPPGEYAMSQTLVTAEGIPPNLAKNVWTELQLLQYKLRHQVVAAGADANTVPTIVKPGKQAINLSGGQAAWQTMLAVPEDVTIEFSRKNISAPGGAAASVLLAQSTIRCGPINHLEPGFKVQLYNLFANRNVQKIDPNQRLNGQTASQQVDLSASNDRENSIPSLPTPNQFNYLFSDPNNNNQVTQAGFGAQIGQLFMRQFAAATGGTAGASLSLKLADAAFADGLN